MVAKQSKLAKLLKAHTSSGLITKDLQPVCIDNAEPLQDPFNIPTDEGQAVGELIDGTSSSYMRSCLVMAQRAMQGLVDPMREGELPHKMALLLASKMIPARRWKDKMPDETPAETKRTARALKTLIKSLAEEGEIIIDTTKDGAKDSLKPELDVQWGVE